MRCLLGILPAAIATRMRCFEVSALVFPGEKRFAFTILDDTDVATVENTRPLYRLLEQLGMRATKTVWPLGCPEGSRDFSSSQTMEDPEYLAYVLDLRRRGFEITWHCATMESSPRERTVAGIERFRSILGSYPRIHANHATNHENIYWGVKRVDEPLLKFLLRLASVPVSLGHVENSPYWWGDLCRQHISYGRNLTFNSLNLAAINPSMPYHDPQRPLVRRWFSASDGEDVDAFNELLCSEQQERLERESGFSIVATHFGKEFVQNARVHPQTELRLRELARRPGWFPTVSELLDWLLERHEGDMLPRREWRFMQWRWAVDLGLRKWKRCIRNRRKA